MEMSNRLASIEAKALERFRARALIRIESYFLHTNQVIGVMGFSFGLACAGLELPSFFAWIGTAFLLLLWIENLDFYKPHFSALRSIREPRLSCWAILKRVRIALVGWVFLGSVAVGIVNKYGLMHT